MSSNVLSSESQNTYTIDGNYTYHEALKALALKTGRSVLGASSGLEMSRNFDIYKKSFNLAVDEMKKNLKTDGYLLFLDTAMFYVVREDSSSEKGKRDSIYTVQLPYSKHFLVTSSKQEFLNAKIIDRENYVRDSTEKYKKTHINIYKCDMYMVGSTLSDSASRGLLLSSPLNVSVDVRNLNGAGFQIGAIAGDNYVWDSLNFQRHIIFYLRGDSMTNLMFGDEARRANAQITSSTGAVSTSFESVYNGLQLNVAPNRYDLTYRLDDNQIKLLGIPGEVCVGSSLFNDVIKQKTWFIFKYKARSTVLFYFAAMFNVQKMSTEVIN
ncbi:MAG TPA: hypothetical protein VMR41_04165 [Patescibacteria group bacterium]|nr:hypothetical protein [Patescibacteria group bacterium]